MSVGSISLHWPPRFPLCHWPLLALLYLWSIGVLVGGDKQFTEIICSSTKNGLLPWSHGVLSDKMCMPQNSIFLKILDRCYYSSMLVKTKKWLLLSSNWESIWGKLMKATYVLYNSMCTCHMVMYISIYILITSVTVQSTSL